MSPAMNHLHSIMVLSTVCHADSSMQLLPEVCEVAGWLVWEMAEAAGAYVLHLVSFSLQHASSTSPSIQLSV